MNGIIALLDGVYSSCLKTDASGRTVYFPNGAFAKGFIVPDAGALALLKRKLRWLYGILIGGAGFLSPFTVRALENLEPVTAIAAGVSAIILLGLASSYLGRTFARGWQRSDTKLEFGEAMRAQSLALPRWFGTFQLVFWSLGLAGGALMLAEATTQLETLKAAGVIACSLALLTVAIASIRARRAAETQR